MEGISMDASLVYFYQGEYLKGGMTNHLFDVRWNDQLVSHCQSLQHYKQMK